MKQALPIKLNEISTTHSSKMNHKEDSTHAGAKKLKIPKKEERKKEIEENKQTNERMNEHSAPILFCVVLGFFCFV